MEEKASGNRVNVKFQKVLIKNKQLPKATEYNHLFKREIQEVAKSVQIHGYIMASTSNEEDKLITTADKYFIEQRNIVLQEIDETMSSILNGLNVLNISLESSIAVGREFQSVSDLWKTFYDGLESIPDEVPIDEQTTLSQAKPTTK